MVGMSIKKLSKLIINNGTYGVATEVFDVIHLKPVPAATKNALSTQAGRKPVL